MEFAFTSETLVGHAYTAFFVVCLITVLMITRIVFLRVRLLLRQGHQAEFRKIWLPIFTKTAMQESCKANGPLPACPRRDVFLFMNEWNIFQETLSGEALTWLNHLARRLKIHLEARRLLQRGTIRQRLVALVFLGHLRDRRSWDHIASHLTHETPLVSILAARSLISLDEGRALPLVFAELTARDDWPTTRVAVLLRNVVSAKELSFHLPKILAKSDDVAAIKLLPYVEQIYNEEKNATLRKLLTRSTSDHFTSRLLKYIDTHHDVDLVRRHLDHKRWHVRMQAVAALGRIGQEQDIPLVIERMGDGQWWVRYRAAQALLKMPGMNTKKLEQIKFTLEDDFAKDMLSQVMVEEERALP